MKRTLLVAALMVGLLTFSACAKEVPLGARAVESSSTPQASSQEVSSQADVVSAGSSEAAVKEVDGIKFSVKVKDARTATFRLTDPNRKDSYQVNTLTPEGEMQLEYCWNIIIGDYEIHKEYITDKTIDTFDCTFDEIPNMLCFHTFEPVKIDGKAADAEAWKDIGFENCTCKVEGKDIVWTIQFPEDCKIDLSKAEEFKVEIFDYTNSDAKKDILFKAADVVTKAA